MYSELQISYYRLLQNYKLFHHSIAMIQVLVWLDILISVFVLALISIQIAKFGTVSKIWSKIRTISYIVLAIFIVPGWLYSIRFETWTKSIGYLGLSCHIALLSFMGGMTLNPKLASTKNTIIVTSSAFILQFFTVLTFRYPNNDNGGNGGNNNDDQDGDEPADVKPQNYIVEIIDPDLPSKVRLMIENLSVTNKTIADLIEAFLKKKYKFERELLHVQVKKKGNINFSTHIFQDGSDNVDGLVWMTKKASVLNTFVANDQIFLEITLTSSLTSEDEKCFFVELSNTTDEGNMYPVIVKVPYTDGIKYAEVLNTGPVKSSGVKITNNFEYYSYKNGWVPIKDPSVEVNFDEQKQYYLKVRYS